MACRHLTQDCWVWFYSCIALGEEVCFGAATLWGQAVCVHQHHPYNYYANSLLGQYWRMSCSITPFGLVTMALASILFCRKIMPLQSLVVSVERHHQTCLPLQESLAARCVFMTICMPVFKGVQLQFPIFYCPGALAMIHLSCQIVPLLSLSPPQHIQAIDLLYFALTGSHWQCVHDIGICWVLVIGSSTMSLTTFILCQIILKCMIYGLSVCFLPWEGNFSSGKSLLQLNIT